MSKPRPDLSTALEDVLRAVEDLAPNIPGLIGIYLFGSRVQQFGSPKSLGFHESIFRVDSDYDLIALTRFRVKGLPDLKKLYGIHADLKNRTDLPKRPLIELFPVNRIKAIRMSYPNTLITERWIPANYEAGQPIKIGCLSYVVMRGHVNDPCYPNCSNDQLKEIDGVDHYYATLHTHRAISAFAMEVSADQPLELDQPLYLNASGNLTNLDSGGLALWGRIFRFGNDLDTSWLQEGDTGKKGLVETVMVSCCCETGDHDHALPDHTHDYANSDHDHPHTHNYAPSSHDHPHDHNYADPDHTHDYANIDHDHPHDHDYAATNHNHDFAATDHDHPLPDHSHDYASTNHDHDYAASAHTHNYADPDHTHTPDHTHDPDVGATVILDNSVQRNLNTGAIGTWNTIPLDNVSYNEFSGGNPTDGSGFVAPNLGTYAFGISAGELQSNGQRATIIARIRTSTGVTRAMGFMYLRNANLVNEGAISGYTALRLNQGDVVSFQTVREATTANAVNAEPGELVMTVTRTR